MDATVEKTGITGNLCRDGVKLTGLSHRLEFGAEAICWAVSAGRGATAPVGATMSGWVDQGASRVSSVAVSLLLIGWSVGPVGAQQWAAKMFKKTTHDFGAVARGSKAEFEFEIRELVRGRRACRQRSQ